MSSKHFRTFRVNYSIHNVDPHQQGKYVAIIWRETSDFGKKMTWNSKSVPITTIISDILSCTCDDSLETKKLVKSLLGNAKWVWPSDLSTKVVEYIGKWICYNISDLFLILLQVRCFQLSYCLDLKCGILDTYLYFRPVVPGCAGCAMAHPEFWHISWPYFNQGGQIMPT